MVLLLVDNSAPAHYGKAWLIENLIGTYGQTIANLTKQPTYSGAVEYVGGENFIFTSFQTFISQV
jgi:hypothetical protein